MDKKKIEKETKELLEKFSKALEKIDEEKIEFYSMRDNFEREEKGSEQCNFKEALLSNAPRKNKDFIIAEKGEWK
ncbi:Asp-tRNA(Asn) amidotransferase GatCAB subunit C [Candidatus Pacearchaeota archaeon]|nr:Asp-tRNA(Asn) amidotransferase GatCAB subunit C [Candidatus Pacearchaeota archaeon]